MKKILGVAAIVALGIILGMGPAGAAGPDKKGPQLKIQTKAARVDLSKIAGPNCFAMEPNVDNMDISAGLSVQVEMHGHHWTSVSNALDVPSSGYNEATPGIFKILYYYVPSGDAPGIIFTIGFVGTSVSDSAASDDARVSEFCPDLHIRQRPFNMQYLESDYEGTDGPVRYYSTNPREPYWISSGVGRCSYNFILDLDGIDLASAGSKNLGVELCSSFGDQVAKGRFLIRLVPNPGDEVDVLHTEGGIIAPWKRGNPDYSWQEWVDRLFE